jgi:phage protein D
VNWDGDIEMSGINEVNKVDDLVTDTSKLKEFGKNKKLNIRDRLKAEQKNKYQKKLETDTREQIDYIEKKQGSRAIEDYVKEAAERGDLHRGADVESIGEHLPTKTKKASGGRVSYFDGGIVSLKKKW